jgi:hypothetical protein
MLTQQHKRSLAELLRTEPEYMDALTTFLASESLEAKDKAISELIGIKPDLNIAIRHAAKSRAYSSLIGLIEQVVKQGA